MNTIIKPLIAVFAFAISLSPVVKADELTCFELRTYHAAAGKLDDLHARFRDHTLALFEKHGITNLIYWVPKENTDNVLVYLVAYPDKTAREESWKAFLADPDWVAAKAASEANGKLVEKVDQRFLNLTDYSPKLPLKAGDAPRLYEMREYTTNDGKLGTLDARFRDHTIALFEKHGLHNLIYFHLDEDQEGSGNTLLYFLAHDSEETKMGGFKSFSEDPEWISARDASEKEGKLLIQKGVKSTLLLPTDYSPVR
jgi:hypothetical protein